MVAAAAVAGWAGLGLGWCHKARGTLGNFHSTFQHMYCVCPHATTTSAHSAEYVHLFMVKMCGRRERDRGQEAEWSESRNLVSFTAQRINAVALFV